MSHIFEGVTNTQTLRESLRRALVGGPASAGYSNIDSQQDIEINTGLPVSTVEARADIGYSATFNISDPGVPSLTVKIVDGRIEYSMDGQHATIQGTAFRAGSPGALAGFMNMADAYRQTTVWQTYLVVLHGVLLEGLAGR